MPVSMCLKVGKACLFDTVCLLLVYILIALEFSFCSTSSRPKVEHKCKDLTVVDCSRPIEL